jgi:hypothetical protein
MWQWLLLSACSVLMLWMHIAASHLPKAPAPKGDKQVHEQFKGALPARITAEIEV